MSLLLLIWQLSKQVETLNDRATCSNADLKADMERWHKTKRRDFRKLFSEMADRNIKYYQQVTYHGDSFHFVTPLQPYSSLLQCLTAWEEAIPLIQKTDQITDDVLQDSSKTKITN